MILASLLLTVMLAQTPDTSLDKIIKKGIVHKAYTGATVISGTKDSITYNRGFGYNSWIDSPEINPDSSIYDLASLTKVVATTTAIMYLYQHYELDVQDRVARYIPEFKGKYKNQVTIEMLLTHTSGLRSGMNLTRYKTPEEAKMAVINSKLYCRPGNCYIYSDLGAILLGIIIERITNQPLDKFVQDSIFIPMGMTHTMYNPSTAFCGLIVSTNLHNECGLVNDENSQALGGVAGHAGLFSSGADLAIFAKMMLNYGRIDTTQFFDSVVVDLFTKEVRFKRALGWVVYKKTDGKVIGHMGFTGTMMLLDMQNGIFAIVLTNRAINRNKPSSFTYLNKTRDSVSIAFVPHFSLVRKIHRHAKKRIYSN